MEKEEKNSLSSTDDISKPEVNFMKILKWTSGAIIAEFYTGILAGQTYSMGGERLGGKDYPKGGFWVHPPTIKKIEPVAGKPTEEELNELKKAFEKYCKTRDFKIKF